MTSPSRAAARCGLRDLVLFALRVLALLALVAAFAWPYLRGANTAPIRESRVYILDNTLSHQANDGFTRDRDRVLSEISKGPSDVQMAVIELTSVPRVVVSFGESREAARQKLKELEPSFQRGSYLAAFRQANSLLGNSLGDQKRIILLGDNQENQWNENVEHPAVPAQCADRPAEDQRPRAAQPLAGRAAGAADLPGGQVPGELHGEAGPHGRSQDGEHRVARQ